MNYTDRLPINLNNQICEFEYALNDYVYPDDEEDEQVNDRPRKKVKLVEGEQR